MLSLKNKKFMRTGQEFIMDDNPEPSECIMDCLEQSSCLMNMENDGRPAIFK